MSNLSDDERKVQNRVIDFFTNTLNYTYIGNLRDFENSNIMTDRLHSYLSKKGYSEKLIKGAVAELDKTSKNLQHGIYDANKNVYNLLKYGAKVKEDIDKPEKTIYFIDFDNPAENDFVVAEEVTIIQNNEKRPDLVVYINGIALAVIELKKSSISVSDGIRQNLTNQMANFIEQFFSTIQFCIAANELEGLRYGTLKTPEKYYLEWKQDGYKEFQDERDETDLLIEEKFSHLDERLYIDLINLFYKKRFLDLIHNFIVFDKGRKKVCRYNQYYAIKRAQKRLTNKHRGGIVWHTQGSGKSLTMVWLSKWILSNNPNARVLIITDREELDDQIEKIFKGVNENIVRTKSGKDLIEKLNTHENRLLCSLIHKFGRRGGEISENDYDKYVDELKASLPTDFYAKGDFVVFVDECHRTQSGKLHKAMTTILPKAILIGFTGTPLLKKDKKTSLEIFGGYIHTYKFNEAVSDGVVLDLRYEARDVQQDISSQQKIDRWFDSKTKGLSPRAKAKLKEKWGNMQKVFSSRSRLEKIANDIYVDFEINSRLADGNGNAMLVADSVYTACKFYEIFQRLGFKKCAIISSYYPNPGDLRTDTVSDDEDTETFEKYSIYTEMLNGQTVEDFEREAKDKFVNEPNNMKLLIVVDKLLTGFDAPKCTYLYIDKTMHDHGLFQAICRVNRLDNDEKDFGYIVDYKQLFGDITDAMNKYTSGAFEKYDKEDVDGLLNDRTDNAKSYFEDTLDELEELCEGVEYPKDYADYLNYFCGETGYDEEVDEIYFRNREKLYKLINKLSRAYEAFKAYMDDAGYSNEQKAYAEERVVFYIELRLKLGHDSGDFIDLKQFEPGMRFLIDNYIVANESVIIAEMDDFTLLDFIINREDDLKSDNKKTRESAAASIENNIRKKIVDKVTVNPAYYAKMSEVLEKLINERKKGALDYKKLLEMYMTLAKNVQNPENNSRYPDSIRKSDALMALYDNCGEDEELALKLHKAVLLKKQEGFRNNPVKGNRIKKELYAILKDQNEVDRIFKIIVEQKEY